MSATAAILFPGQGAQAVGMGKDLAEKFPAARAIFEQADRVLGIPLSRYCFEGPEATLTQTDISQPAIYTMSVAAWAALKSTATYRDLAPAAAAGLSLGEYTALWLAGVFDFETGLKIVRERGLAMQAAALAVPSSMVAIMGLDESALQRLCAEAGGDEVLVPANYNAPGQVVISGAKGACERAVPLCEQLGGKATPLVVAGAFHSPLMRPAVERLRTALDQAQMSAPKFPVVANVTGEPHIDSVEAIRDLLCVQCAEPIRWEQSMRYLLAHEYSGYYEVGPGRVLSGLMRRIERKIKVTNISDASVLA